MIYSECVTNRTPFLEITYPEIERQNRTSPFNFFHLNRRNPERKIFIKSFNEQEFVGEEVCRLRGIRSAHYFLVGINPNTILKYTRRNYYGDVRNDNFKYMIGSYDFRDYNKEYFDLSSIDLGDNALDTILNMCPNEENRDEVLNEILELMALDIFMGQEDRCSKNVMIEKDKNGIIHLAPIYDFQYALKNPSLYYENDIMSLRDNRDYHRFMDEYSHFRDLLDFYSDEDLYTITQSALDKHSMRIPDGHKKYLKQYSKNRRQLIKNILK